MESLVLSLNNVINVDFKVSEKDEIEANCSKNLEAHRRISSSKNNDAKKKKLIYFRKG